MKRQPDGLTAPKIPLLQLGEDVKARAKASGLAIGLADGLIAAIAMEHGFSVATRDVEPFEAAGVDVINPWVA